MFNFPMFLANEGSGEYSITMRVSGSFVQFGYTFEKDGHTWIVIEDGETAVLLEEYNNRNNTPKP